MPLAPCRPPACAFLLLLAACGGSAPETTCDVRAPAAGGDPAPTFDNVRHEAFRVCSTSRCHPAVNPPGKAVISSRDELAQATYDTLVNAPSATDVEGRAAPNVPTRVVPRDPEASFLVWKLLGHDPANARVAVVGDRMPSGCSGETCLSCDEQQLVWRWIAAGAARN
jgi:hypothetical protein